MPVIFAIEGCPCSGKSSVLHEIAAIERAREAAGETPAIVVVPEPVAAWSDALRGIDADEPGARLALQSLVVQHYVGVHEATQQLDPAARVILERSPLSIKVFALIHKQYDPSRAAAYDFVLSGMPQLAVSGYFELLVDADEAALRAAERWQCGDNKWTADALRTYGAVFEAVFEGVPRTPMAVQTPRATAEAIVEAITAARK